MARTPIKMGIDFGFLTNETHYAAGRVVGNNFDLLWIDENLIHPKEEKPPCLCCMWFIKNYIECAERFEINIPFYEIKDKNNLPTSLILELIL